MRYDIWDVLQLCETYDIVFEIWYDTSDTWGTKWDAVLYETKSEIG